MGLNNTPNYYTEMSPQPTHQPVIFGRRGCTVNIVSGITKLRFSRARISAARADTRESGASGSVICGVDFLDFDFLSITKEWVFRKGDVKK